MFTWLLCLSENVLKHLGFLFEDPNKNPDLADFDMFYVMLDLA